MASKAPSPQCSYLSLQGFHLRYYWLAQVAYFPSNAASLTAHPLEFLMLAGCGLVTSFTSKQAELLVRFVRREDHGGSKGSLDFIVFMSSRRHIDVHGIRVILQQNQ